MGVTSVMEDDGGAGSVIVTNSAVTESLRSLSRIHANLNLDHENNLKTLDKMCVNWRSQVGLSASAFYYASVTLANYSKYCLDTIQKAKQTMKDYSNDMDIIDKDLEAMNFMANENEGE